MTVDVRVHFTVGETPQRRSRTTPIDSVTPTGRYTCLDHENLDVCHLLVRIVAMLTRMGR